MKRLMDILEIVSPEYSESHLKSYLKAINIESEIRQMGADAAEKREFLSKQVNMQRLSNNPVGLTQMHVNRIFKL